MVCSKHPELEGKRITSERSCIECGIEQLDKRYRLLISAITLQPMVDLGLHSYRLLYSRMILCF